MVTVDVECSACTVYNVSQAQLRVMLRVTCECVINMMVPLIVPVMYSLHFYPLTSQPISGRA
jgi:hypothetical protein